MEGSRGQNHRSYLWRHEQAARLERHLGHAAPPATPRTVRRVQARRLDLERRLGAHASAGIAPLPALLVTLLEGLGRDQRAQPAAARRDGLPQLELRALACGQRRGAQKTDERARPRGKQRPRLEQADEEGLEQRAREEESGGQAPPGGEALQAEAKQQGGQRGRREQEERELREIWRDMGR